MPESVATSASCGTADLFEDARTCAGHWLPRVRPLPLLKNALLASGTALNGTDLCVTEAGWARHRAACALGQQQRLETVLGPLRKVGHQRRGVEVPPPPRLPLLLVRVQHRPHCPPTPHSRDSLGAESGRTGCARSLSPARRLGVFPPLAAHSVVMGQSHPHHRGPERNAASQGTLIS